MLHMGSVHAQQAKADAEDTLKLDQVIVTGTATARSKMTQSNSISSLSTEQMQQNQPMNAADVLRAIPGLRAESSGGGGNANVTVRGLPISAGGSRYVQFQEDGLPVLLFGDVAFATPDMFLSTDNTIEKLEVVRGGSGSTLATNSPGGIINFITRDGSDKGGSLGLSTGLGFDEKRLDFDLGGRLGEKTRYFIGGFSQQGEGPRHSGNNALDGGALKANITQELENGYVRLNFKHLDTQSPLFMPAPVRISKGQISEIPGIDPRKASFYSPYWVTDYTLSKNNTQVGTNVNDGLRVKSNAFGVESELNLADGWKLSEKFRTASNSGRFVSLFPADDVANVKAGTTYASGPNKGKAYTGPAFTATVFNTSLDDMGTSTNDVKLSKSFAQADGAKLSVTGGLFLNVQHVALTWNFNQYLLQATDDKPALLANSGTNSYGAVALGTDVWGGCCTRAIDAEYRTTSPYAAIGWDQGPLSIDASLRRDQQKASGSYNQAVAQKFQPGNAQAINYTLSHTSYSVGVNYQIDSKLAVFARVSDGVAFNADRIMFDPAAKPLDGRGVVPLNEVKQIEGGVKMRSGGLSSFVTLFQAKTDESNYDATTQKSSANRYDAKGVEVELGYRLGAFKVNGGFTYTDAKVLNNGTTPNRQAKMVYQFSPSYVMGELQFGATVVGTSSAKDAQGTPYEATLPAYAVVNLFANYALNQDWTLSAGVYNVGDKIGYTESNDGRGAARAINGRSARLGLKYKF
nr:TonB-dependent receptor [Massilia sp. TS11]